MCSSRHPCLHVSPGVHFDDHPNVCASHSGWSFRCPDPVPPMNEVNNGRGGISRVHVISRSRSHNMITFGVHRASGFSSPHDLELLLRCKRSVKPAIKFKRGYYQYECHPFHSLSTVSPCTAPPLTKAYLPRFPSPIGLDPERKVSLRSWAFRQPTSPRNAHEGTLRCTRDSTPESFHSISPRSRERVLCTSIGGVWLISDSIFFGAVCSMEYTQLNSPGHAVSICSLLLWLASFWLTYYDGDNVAE